MSYVRRCGRGGRGRPEESDGRWRRIARRHFRRKRIEQIDQVVAGSGAYGRRWRTRCCRRRRRRRRYRCCRCSRARLYLRNKHTPKQRHRNEAQQRREAYGGGELAGAFATRGRSATATRRASLLRRSLRLNHTRVVKQQLICCAYTASSNAKFRS